MAIVGAPPRGTWITEEEMMNYLVKTGNASWRKGGGTKEFQKRSSRGIEWQTAQYGSSEGTCGGMRPPIVCQVWSRIMNCTETGNPSSVRLNYLAFIHRTKQGH